MAQSFSVADDVYVTEPQGIPVPQDSCSVSLGGHRHMHARFYLLRKERKVDSTGKALQPTGQS